MGIKVMSAAARWLLLCPSGRARQPYRIKGADSVQEHFVLTTDRVLTYGLSGNEGRRYERSEERSPRSSRLGRRIRLGSGSRRADGRGLRWLRLVWSWGPAPAGESAAWAARWWRCCASAARRYGR